MSHELCATNIHRRFFVTLAHAYSPFERGRYTVAVDRHQVIEVMSAINTPARKSRVVIDTTRALRHATR